MKEKYLSLLRKAVPFTPMNDITRFITEYICDVESEIDVMAMQSDIRKYTELEHDAEIMKSRITRLEEIGKSDESYQGAKEILRLQQMILSMQSRKTGLCLKNYPKRIAGIRRISDCLRQKSKSLMMR